MDQRRRGRGYRYSDNVGRCGHRLRRVFDEQRIPTLFRYSNGRDAGPIRAARHPTRHSPLHQRQLRQPLVARSRQHGRYNRALRPVSAAHAVIIDAGKLDRSLTLLTAGGAKTLDGTVRDELGQIVRDELGQPHATYAPLATIRAQRLDIRTQDAARAGGRETFALARFLIRWRANLSTDMRAQVDGRLYDIKAVDELDRRRSIILTCEEVTRA